ncbi:MAG: V-type ATP synthase subunit F [Caldilineaceae bacterium]|nr:V-type ATP synthase subunit F [Caldilineaceae bacterium]
MAQLIVITHPDLAAGFRLAGVETYSASSPEEAQRQLQALLDDEEAGLIAMDQGFLEALDSQTQRRIERIYRPVVIGIPMGKAGGDAAARRLQLAELIRRAIGVRISFRGGEE